MVKVKRNVFGCVTNFLRGKKCVFCGSFRTNKTKRGYVKCEKCKKQKSLKRIRTEIAIIKGFYQPQPAYQLANDLDFDYQTIEVEVPMDIIRKKTRKGSVYYTDTFKSYHSLKRLGKHHTVNHSKNMVDKGTKNHINGIEGFWSFAKRILYNYRGVSKYHFPMYLKEVKCRYNHRHENLFKLFLNIFFSYETHSLPRKIIIF